ncbi:MAG: MFS transporter [Candidatus Rokubacteria bacterium]|nr:MFS transporter [Candidatus Rokubacteria bacterium]
MRAVALASPYRWVILALTVVAFMQTHLHRLAFAPLIPTFVSDLGLSYAAAGTVQTAYFWTYASMQLPVGLATDRWGARRVMLTCLAALAVGTLAFAASATYLTAFLARMLVGLGAAAVWVPGMRLISEWFPSQERGRATGVMSSGGGIGGTLGLIVVPWLATYWGWRIAYGAMVVPAVVTFVLVALLMRSGGTTHVGPPSRGTLRRVIARRELWTVNMNVVCSYGAYFSFITFLPSYLVRALGYGDAQAGVITALITGGTIVSWPLAGLVSDRLGRRKPLLLLGQMASVLVPLAFAWIVPLFGAAAMAIAFASGLLVGGLILPSVMIVEMFPREEAATAMGVVNSASFVGGIFLPIVLGAIVDATGSFTHAFIVAAAIEVVALVFATLVPETGPRGRGERPSWTS